MDRKTLESAILALAGDGGLLARFKSQPIAVGAELRLSAEWAEIINRGDRDRLRSAGVNDGITILVSRWFKDDLGDSTNKGRLQIDRTSPLPEADVPANLVFAGGCSHVPDLLARPEIDPPDSVARLLDGYHRLGAELSRAKVDTVIVTADCHFQSFDTGAFVVGVGARHAGSMAFFKRPDIALEVQGDSQLAADIVKAVRQEGLEVEESPAVALDHGLIVPLQCLKLDPSVKVVPIITQPARTFSPFGARAFGGVLRGVVQASGKRVAMLATGGLSHWLDPGKFGAFDLEFDSYILGMLEAGRGYDLGNLEPYPLLDHGQYEFLNWLIMLGLVGPGVRGERLAYEPMEASGGGWAVVHMKLPQEGQTHG
jgi:aromatic ring-opening dioxygenase catalytic subunit (LigB family)